MSNHIKIQREWLKRIPQGTWIRRKGRKASQEPGEEGYSGAQPTEEGTEEGIEEGTEAAAPPLGEALPEDAPPDAEGEHSAAEDEQQATEGDPTQEEETPPDAAADSSEGAGDGTGEGNDEDSQPPPISTEDNPLHIPEEEQQRREEEKQIKERGRINRHLAAKAFNLEGHYLRGLATQFARMVSKVAEDSADLPQPGDEEWDVVALSQRRFTGQHIHQCRMTRDKRKVAVVLDTSPSCEHQARLFGAIAHVAEELGDCELYDAPNFAIASRKIGEAWEELPRAEREWQFKRRVVLAFGDFDGMDRINAASAVRGNKIYWFSCEERPVVLESHRNLLVKGFKGHYFPAVDMNQLMRAMKRVR